MTKKSLVTLVASLALAACSVTSSTPAPSMAAARASRSSGAEADTTARPAIASAPPTPAQGSAPIADVPTVAPATVASTPTAPSSAEALLSAGHAAFDHACGGCHPGGERGRGPNLHDAHLTLARITRKIRHGTGRMPAIGTDVLGDEDLPNVLAWLGTIGAVDAPRPERPPST